MFVHSARPPLRAAFLATLAMIMLVVSACGGAATGAPVAAPNAANPAAPTAAAPVAAPNAPTAAPSGNALLINGAGATFPYPLYSRWFYEYASINPTAKFNYQSIGSGGGIQQITAKTVDFAGSDAILTDAQYQAVAPAKLQMFPSVAGGVVLSYNVQELQGKAPLVLDGQTLANIFLGKITKWNDPAIAALNPNLTLPAKDIIVVHRSDGSGTTYIFTSYLSTISSDWKSQVGSSTSVNWPVGLGGKGNEGVAGTVSQNDGAMGYVELAYAKQNKLSYANMKNAAGNILEATSQTIQNAMTDFGGNMPDSLTISIVNAPGKDSWPIAGYTYLILYMDQQDCARGKAVVSFMQWALSDTGSKFATDLDYVPLPTTVRTQVLAKLGQVTCQGKPLQ